MDTLLFIDTNIFLDFYRTSDQKLEAALLPKILQRKNNLVLTTQVHNEFLKNRHEGISELLKSFNTPKLSSLATPPVFSDDELVSARKDLERGVNLHYKAVQKRIVSFLSDPSGNDPVYRTVDELFSKGNRRSTYRASSSVYEQIVERARTRFSMGHPPGKSRGNAFGDAINWECILSAAAGNRANIIIVSRDEDFGLKYDGQIYVNDFLMREFREKVGKRQSLRIMPLLSKALEEAGARVSAAVKGMEEKFLAESDERVALAAISNYNIGEQVRALIGGNFSERFQAVSSAARGFYGSLDTPGVAMAVAEVNKALSALPARDISAMLGEVITQSKLQVSDALKGAVQPYNDLGFATGAVALPSEKASSGRTKK